MPAKKTLHSQLLVEIADIVEPIMQINKEIVRFEKTGFKVKFESWAAMGNPSTATIEIKLISLTKNIVNSKVEALSDKKLQALLKKLNKLLKGLEERGICVDVSVKRPNDAIWLYIEFVGIGVHSPHSAKIVEQHLKDKGATP